MSSLAGYERRQDSSFLDDIPMPRHRWKIDAYVSNLASMKLSVVSSSRSLLQLLDRRIGGKIPNLQLQQYSKLKVLLRATESGWSC